MKKHETTGQSFRNCCVAVGSTQRLCAFASAINILSNGVRHAKDTVTVTVDAQDGYVRLTLSDDGEGIARRDLPHIFERFYKGKKR